MERDAAAGLALFWPEPASAGDVVVLTAGALRHALVRRVSNGDAARLLDGHGRVAHGAVNSVLSRSVSIEVSRVEHVLRPAMLEVLVPVADRDRMLWAAEKCVEHRVTAWRPVLYARSRSVSSRGEGARFAEKVRARMVSALEQSGGAWLPEIHAETDFAAALHSAPAGAARILLESSGAGMAGAIGPSVVLAAGPEGGFEQQELAAARNAGWVTASLGASILRFETAIISGAAVVRAHQLSTRGG